MPPGRPWGTIPRTRFKLGYQKLTDFELEQSVERLYRNRTKQVRQWWPEQTQHKQSSEEEISKIVDRLYKQQLSRPSTDSRRISTGRIKEMGIVNSYAWKGYN